MTETETVSNQLPANQLAILLNRQKRAFARQRMPDLATRLAWLDRAIALLVENQGALCDVMEQDFGSRSRYQSQMADIYGALASLKYARENVSKWMKDEKRKTQPPMGLLGAKAWIRYQPKGVVGVISTWNFPVWVPFSALGGIFAAGNRCLIKLSEHTPATSGLLAKLIGQYFEEDEFAAVTGGADVAESFSQLPFDHLMFTGSTTVGRKVMEAASKNLVPVTLELGGKSPAIIGSRASLKKVADSLILGKTFNAGQVCLSPDYVLVHKNALNELIAELERAFKKYFPTLAANPDYTAIINQAHMERLASYLDDAKNKGGELWVLKPGDENVAIAQEQKIPLTLVVEPTDDMEVMRHEIFGPVLPIKSYSHIDETIEYVNDRPRPLALYYYGSQKQEQEKVLRETTSGGVAINDVIQHASVEDLPFGGVGDSGIGSYHGIEGFRNFSHARSVYKQAKLNLMALAGLAPPYTEKADKVLQGMIKK